MRLGMALLRAVVGALFVGHGLQKLKGWFGGRGLEATAEGFEAIGLRPGKVHALAAGVSETAGGVMLAGGLLTPLGASMLSGTMAVAIDTVHAKNGPWVAKGGYEYNLVLMASLFAIAAAGPGAWSLDGRLGIERSGAGLALAQLAAGLAAGAAVARVGRPGVPGQGPSGAARAERETG
jgi:putative oxidoreductase